MRAGDLKRRAAFAVGAAAAAVAMAPSLASAATLQVNDLDGGVTDGVCDSDCSLADAMTADNNSHQSDEISLRGLSGTINLTAELPDVQVSNNRLLNVVGPGADQLTISGGGTRHIFHFDGSDPVNVYDVTLANAASSTGGAAVNMTGAPAGVASLINVKIINAKATSSTQNSSIEGAAVRGGSAVELTGSEVSATTVNALASGIQVRGGAVFAGGGAVSLDDSRISTTFVGAVGNAVEGGAVDASETVAISNSTIDATHVEGRTVDGGAAYAPIELSVDDDSTVANTQLVVGFEAQGGALKSPTVDVRDSTVRNTEVTAGANTSIRVRGGALFSTNTATSASPLGPTDVRNSSIAGTRVDAGANGSVDGAAVGTYPSGSLNLSDSEIRDSQATGGLVGGTVAVYGGLRMARSTLAGNTLRAIGSGSGNLSGGGGILLLQTAPQGEGRTIFDSTISGNSAEYGGGVAFNNDNSGLTIFQDSTVAGNSATTTGGGLWAAAQPSKDIRMANSIVGDNQAPDGPDLSLNGQSLQASSSLIETPGSNTIVPVNGRGPNITGQDPQLGALADNGGPTRTMLPAASSPAIDAGERNSTVDTDQRGFDRTVDLAAANVTDGTDIGAVERAKPAPTIAPAVTPPPAAPATPRDTIAPVLSKPKLSPDAFSVDRGASASAARKRRGTRLSLTLSEPATVVFVTEQRVGRRWRKVRIFGKRLPGGRTTLNYSGLIKPHGKQRALRPGRYRLRMRPSDRAGNRGKVTVVGFRIVG